MSNVTIKIYGDGEFWVDGKKRGKLYPDGDLYIDGKQAGKVYPDGDIYLWNRKVGKIYENGEVWVDEKRVLTGVYLLSHQDNHTDSKPVSKVNVEDHRPNTSNTTFTPAAPSFDFSSIGCIGSLFGILLFIAIFVSWFTILPEVLFESAHSGIGSILMPVCLYGSMIYGIYAQWDVGSRAGTNAFDYGLIRQAITFFIVAFITVFFDSVVCSIQYGATIKQFFTLLLSSFGVRSLIDLLFAILVCFVCGLPPAVIGTIITAIYLKAKGPRKNAPQTVFLEKRILAALVNMAKKDNTKPTAAKPASASTVRTSTNVSATTHRPQAPVKNTHSVSAKSEATPNPTVVKLLKLIVYLYNHFLPDFVAHILLWILWGITLFVQVKEFMFLDMLKPVFAAFSAGILFAGLLSHQYIRLRKKIPFLVLWGGFGLLQLAAFYLTFQITDFPEFLFILTYGDTISSTLFMSLMPAFFCWNIDRKVKK